MPTRDDILALANKLDPCQRASVLRQLGEPQSGPVYIQGQTSKPAPTPRRGRMNKLEAAYADLLEISKRQGGIKRYYFEGIKLRLGDGSWYTPDFLVINHDRRIELYEIKGFWREAARVRIRVAATLYPHFTFVGVQRVKGEWITEDFPAWQFNKENDRA